MWYVLAFILVLLLDHTRTEDMVSMDFRVP
jgi:hypothetical protein